MKLQFHRYIPWFGPHPNKDIPSPVMSTGTLLEAPKEKAIFDAKFWNWSCFSFIPWAVRARDKIQLPTTVNRELKKCAQPRGSIESITQYSAIRFRPYVSKVPWHTGPRGFLSQLFPRYGHYCGPNWSSGRDRGSPIWDKRPIDWLDFCCYCHDIGYDTHDQAELLKADLAFLECLERPHMSMKGDPQVAYLYKFMCISGHPHSCSAASPIKTVVVLVMENRSFDHMLGWMKKLNPEINGVDGSESNQINTTDPNSSRVFFGDQSHFVDPDPGHSFQAIREQIFGSNDTSFNPPPMNGFAQQAFSMDPNMPQSVMNGFDPDKVAVYKALVSEFAVFDRWFASVPASTQPNRLYVHSGTSHGATSNVAALLAKGYPQRTIFEDLDDAGISFGIYYQNIPATLFYRNLRKLKYMGKFHPYGLSFKNDAKNGKLPGYTVVEQRYMDSKVEPANDDHPSHDVYQGQMFVKEVYEILRASPQWNETLFVITYDEHGGFYDHVATPNNGVPSPDGIVGPDPFFFKFDRLGVRVPTIVISPWIAKGTVVHGPKGSPSPTSEYEHSSIPATVRKIFNLSSPPLTKREEWAGTFEGILQKLSEPRIDCPEQLPTPVKIRQGDANEDAKVSEFQQELIQLAAVLKGDDILTSYPGKIGKNMTVREGKEYMENAVKSFFEAGFTAKKMGVDEEQIVKMRPSLSTRS